jgi:hypothetical protein
MTVARELKADDQRLGSLPLFLSLFLLLLAFFIFLNSISTIEVGKSDRVIASIRSSFPGFGEGGEGPGLQDDDDLGVVEKSVAARLEEAFAFAFPRLPLKIVNEAERIFVDVPLERLFVPGTSEARVTLRVLSRRLSKVLANPSPRQVLETQILFGHSTAGGELADDQLTLERATVIIESMIVAGSPKRLTSVGLEPGHLADLRFRFRAMARTAGSARTGARE